MIREKDLIHASRANHAYIAKVGLGGNKYKYFYDLASYNAYKSGKSVKTQTALGNLDKYTLKPGEKTYEEKQKEKAKSSSSSKKETTSKDTKSKSDKKKSTKKKSTKKTKSKSSSSSTKTVNNTSSGAKSVAAGSVSNRTAGGGGGSSVGSGGGTSSVGGGGSGGAAASSQNRQQVPAASRYDNGQNLQSSNEIESVIKESFKKINKQTTAEINNRLLYSGNNYLTSVIMLQTNRR